MLGTALPRAQVHTISEFESLQATGTDDVRASQVRTTHEQVAATVRQGEHEKTFIISQKSERDLTIHLGWKSVAKLIAGPALTLFGLGWWLNHIASKGGL